MTKILSPPACVDDVLFDMTHHALEGGFDEHGHDCVEIVLIVGGAGIQILDGKPQKAYPGCVAVIHPGATHGFAAWRGGELYNISCTPDLFRAVGVSLPFLRNWKLLFGSPQNCCSLRLDGVLFHDTRRLLARMFDLYEHREAPDRQMQLRSFFSILLILLAQSWEAKETGDPRLAATLDYMERHYNEKLALDALAKRARMSKNLFLRQFNRETGVSPHRYVMNLRMKHARRLLEESELTIDQIAEVVGFYDSNYFIKLHRKQFGAPPGAHRRRLREEGVR